MTSKEEEIINHNKKEKIEGITKDIYFLILYQIKEKEKEDKIDYSEIDIKNIFKDEKQENGTIYVLKFIGKTNHNYTIEFERGKTCYIITFEDKENSFVYDVELKKGNKIFKNIEKEIIDQTIITYHKKLDLFLEALKRNNEEDKIETLYRDTIDLFGKKKDFNILISLFVQLYKNKELCPLLMGKFKEMNNKAKNHEKNMNRNKDLEKYIDIFKDISSEADNLIKNNDYDPINFYGIILCYLNYYAYDYFIKIINKLFEEKREILFEILIIYFSNILKPINQNLDFFVEFIDYTASKKEFTIFENVLKYIRDIETFIIVIEKTKEKIVKKYVTSKDSFNPIKLKASLEFKKKEKNEEMNDIIQAIKSIINYSKEKKVLLVNFTSNFWIQLLKEYNVPNIIIIKKCYELRNIFFEYNDLVNEFFKNDKRSVIKKDINKFFDRDEFAFLLNENIKKCLYINKGNKENKELSNTEKIALIEAYNPYYKEDKYINKKDSSIFDYIDLDDKDEAFILTFKKLHFEKIFKDNIIEFLYKMVSKIKNIANLGTILEIIDIKKIPKIDYFYNQLKIKYENDLQGQIESLTGEKLNKAVKILVKFFDIIYIHEKKCDFIEKKISKLDEKIRLLIYNELMKSCKGDEYKSMKELIYQKIFNEIYNIDNIIDVIDSLDKKDKIIFLEGLIKKCKFTKEEFYSNNKNNKIAILCELNEKERLKVEDESIDYGEIKRIISEIREDLDGNIEIKKLQKFLKNEKDEIIKRLGLIKLILKDFEPKKKYIKLKIQIEKIQININEFISIKNCLSKFHNNKYQDEIRNISNIINDLKENTLRYFFEIEKKKELIHDFNKLNEIAEQVKKVKDFMLFKILYDEEYGNDQEKRFNQAFKKLEDIKVLFNKKANIQEIYQKNKDIFNKIKEMISDNKSKEEIIKQMTDYFEISEKKELINELTIILKSKKFEMDLKSIIYFFENLNIEKDDNKDKWNEIISNKYKKLSEMNIEDLKTSLNKLKENGIYDYEETNITFDLFTSLYEKKEAIDFLLSKNNQDISVLYERIDPTNKAITKQNIQDTEECIKIFNEFKKLKNNFKIFEHIKTKLTKDQISKFINYSKNYLSIIELDRNDDSSVNLCQQVNNYIQNATFIFRQDYENFVYGGREKTSMEELIHLKNKINIKPPTEKEEDPKDDYQKKCQQLIFFKNLISNLELIYEYMKFLRIKGSSLPILINIKIKYPKIEYFLNTQKTDFENIRNFLFLAKTDYITQLDSIYKQKIYLRFLFGKLFRKIMKHLDGGYNVLDILKYILNKTDNEEDIKDGKTSNPLKAEDMFNNIIYIMKILLIIFQII